MNVFLANTIRFLLLALFQVLVLNNLEFGGGIYIMVYPLFLFLLPIEWSVFSQLVIAFGFGLFIDMFTNYFGLHASSALLFVYFKPMILKLNQPRDGYEITENSSLLENSTSWFIYTFGLLLTLHHLWFFTLEVFKFNEFYIILKKLVFSVPFSLALCVLYKYIFGPKTSER